ncbi:MAG: hypothetical protein K6G03_05225 [Lachnospiraceae bacterium]|nr:hypothetical protein [Lachnospiraceae bacterium]
MDNFMDRLVERMNDRDTGYEDNMQQDNYSSGSRGRMDYREPDDGYGYGRSQRTTAPSVGRRDLEELGRAVISAQKKISDNQTTSIEALKSALVDQAKGLDEGFKEQDQKIDASADKVLAAVKELANDVKTVNPVQNTQPDAITKAYMEELTADITVKSADAIHKEDVKLYKNVQAIVEENASNLNKAINAGSAKTSEEVKAALASLTQLEKINELEAALAETKEELVNRTAGAKAKLTVILLLSLVNFVGVAVLVAIAFGFL